LESLLLETFKSSFCEIIKTTTLRNFVDFRFVNCHLAR
jgi:hypothetical protein